MVGPAIHGQAATHGQKEPFFALVWTHFEGLHARGHGVDFCTFLHMHVPACLDCRYVLIRMNSETVAKH